VSVYDDSFYTYIAYATEGVAAIDPTRDPMFTDRGAPSRPEDFNRFAKTVGLAKFSGKIKASSDTQPFKIATNI
jgi:hypothetical protein